MAGSQDGQPPRRGRVLSFGGKSDKSHKSSGSISQRNLTESPEEKAARTLHTKADPTLAMNEAQPATVALEKSNLTSLRSMRHKDRYGNIITDPDLSNPTRYRFERPLETIRAFQAAIDGTYNSRHLSYAQTDPSNGGYSRRESYYGGPNGGNMSANRGYYEQGNNFYGGRGNLSRPESFIDNYGAANHQHNSHLQHSYYGGRSRQPRHSERVNLDSGHHTSNFYPQQPYQRSSENMTSGSGSGGSNNTDQWGIHTDPSSVNSSLDRLQPQHVPQKPERGLAETYGFNGFGPGPQLDSTFASPAGQEYNASVPLPHGTAEPYVYNNGDLDDYGQAPPAPPPKDTTPSAPSAAVVGGVRGRLQKHISGSEKRSSWLKRRFSKD